MHSLLHVKEKCFWLTKYIDLVRGGLICGKVFHMWLLLPNATLRWKSELCLCVRQCLFSMQCYCYQYNGKYYRCYLFKFKMGIGCSILHKNSFQKGEFVNQVIVCKKIDMDLSKANTFMYTTNMLTLLLYLWLQKFWIMQYSKTKFFLIVNRICPEYNHKKRNVFTLFCLWWFDKFYALAAMCKSVFKTKFGNCFWKETTNLKQLLVYTCTCTCRSAWFLSE